MTTNSGITMKTYINYILKGIFFLLEIYFSIPPFVEVGLALSIFICELWFIKFGKLSGNGKIQSHAFLRTKLLWLMDVENLSSNK